MKNWAFIQRPDGVHTMIDRTSGRELVRADWIEVACAHLREARRILGSTKAKKAASYVRRAIKSADGALRHALNDESRAERHREDRERKAG